MGGVIAVPPELSTVKQCRKNNDEPVRSQNKGSDEDAQGKKENETDNFMESKYLRVVTPRKWCAEGQCM
jgi:hypothetical protein